ncbi:hypothetical protein OROMI_001798 [Orobanche minor]
MSDCKLVVLGIPWDVETEGLREYMSKFGELEDYIVMKFRIFVKWLEGCVPQGSLCKSPEEKRPDVLRLVMFPSTILGTALEDWDGICRHVIGALACEVEALGLFCSAQ